jgi:pimeloyl-ACP methyl ester carboxylesterase
MNGISNNPRPEPGKDSELDSDYVTQVERRAIYFGKENTPLFGWLHMSRAHPVSKMGMVLCPPLGSDYLNTYPVLRHLANRLAYHGIPVLRFDYSGTGNSAGFDMDPDRVSSWMNDIHEARGTLSNIAGCTAVGLFGVRIGGLLAAKYSQNNQLPCLAIWGPVAQGRKYMREMRAMHLTAEGVNNSTITENDNIEAGGFIYTPQTVKELSLISLDSLIPKSENILFAARDDLLRDQDVPQDWLNVEQCTLPGFSGMLTSPHDPLYSTPFIALDRLTQWIVNVAESADPILNNQESGNHPPSVTSTAILRAAPDETQASVRETAIYFGAELSRFAIISEPLNNCVADSPWVIISGTGADPTSGTNRLTTLLSRKLAHAGMRCVRFDFPGVGDSIVPLTSQENRSYQENNSCEIGLLIDEIQRSRGNSKFILMGLCSGAFASFHAGLELKQQPIIECLLLNPLIFYWEESKIVGNQQQKDEIKLESIEQYNRWKYYLGQMRNIHSWKNLFSAKTDLKPLVRAILHRVRNALSEYLQSWTGRSKTHDDDQLTHDIRSMVESGRQLTFVFARADHGYGLLMTHAGAIVRFYIRKKRLKIWFIDRTNHIFSSHTPRTELINTVANYLARSYGTYK